MMNKDISMIQSFMPEANFLPFIQCRFDSTFRLKVDNNGGAWCPKHIVSRGLKEYIQIDLLQMHAITAIRSQGRFGRGQGQEYTEAYVVEYWRTGFTKWERWKNTQNKEVGGIQNHYSIYRLIDAPKYMN